MPGAQGRIRRIARQRLAILIGLQWIDQDPGRPVAHQAGRASGQGGDHRQSARHRFLCDIAERLGDRRVEEHVGAGQRNGEIVAGLLADEDRAGGQIGLEPAARRPVADHQHAMPDLALDRRVDRIDEHVEPLFHHDPAEERDDHFVILHAVRAAPLHAPPPGVELIAVDPASPDRNVAAHPLRVEHCRGRFGRRDDRIATPIQSPKQRPERRLEQAQPIIFQIGLEPCVDRRHHRNAPRAGPGHGAVRDHVGARDMDDIGRKRLQVSAHRCVKRGGDSIFGPPRHRDRRDIDEVTRGRKGWLVTNRRIDADMRALAQQIADQPVKRLVGPVADIIVIAREQGDAQVARFHRRVS